MPDEQMTEEELTAFAGRVLGEVKPLLETVRQLPVPEDGSPLARNDREAHPHKPSHTVRRLLGAATEHLDALHALLVVAKIQHPSAPYTLMRSAIECAASAVWLVIPNLHAERVQRALRLALQDTTDQARLERAHLLTARRSLAERQASIQAIADRATGQTVTIPQTTAILRDVETATAATGRRLDVLMAWQVCSGFAHGRVWPVLAISDREEMEQSGNGDILLRTTGSTRNLTWATLTAVNATTLGAQLYRRRATTPYRD